VEVAGVNAYPAEHWLQLTVSVGVLLQVAHPELSAVQAAETLKHMEQSNTIVIELNNQTNNIVVIEFKTNYKYSLARCMLYYLYNYCATV